MAADENARIVANRGAAGTDWEGIWCVRECLYSSKSGRRRHRLEGEGAAGARRVCVCWGGLFPPLLRVEARGTSHAASKVIARALQRGEASYIYISIC